MKYTGQIRGTRYEAKNDSETKKKELKSEGYLIGNDFIEKHPFFGTYRAIIYYSERR